MPRDEYKNSYYSPLYYLERDEQRTLPIFIELPRVSYTTPNFSLLVQNPFQKYSLYNTSYSIRTLTS